MCASYMIKQRTAGKFRLLTEARIDIEEYFDKLIVPGTPAPVIVDEKNTPVLKAMKFSMIPRWSKEPKCKFATHNARLDSIDEKPTWKWAFVQHHCLVPMTDFIEPIYEGDHAGHMVAFYQKSGELIYAAGLWDEWVNKETGEVIQSFAIITHEPPKFVAEVGHDRCPVFLDEDNGQEWLQNTGESGKALKQFLLGGQVVPEFDVVNHRAMRPGWEKRK